MSSISLTFDEKNENVIIWNGLVVMSRTEEPYFQAIFQRLAYLNPNNVLEIGFGLGISANLIQKYLKPTRHDIYEIEQNIYHDLINFAKNHPSVNHYCGDWKQFTADILYDFIFFDPFDFITSTQDYEMKRADNARRMKSLLSFNGVLCHPHFGDGDVPNLPGFTTIIVERITVSPIRMADGTYCTDVAIVFHQPLDAKLGSRPASIPNC